MARLEGGREGWGAVDHPETGELIQLDEDHPTDVAETVAEAYTWLEVVSGEDTPPKDYKCGHNGCGRSVDDADAKCWQHP